MHKILSLQTGRALACLLVVLYHLGDFCSGTGYHRWTVFGHNGVTYFFVLSGFVLFYAHRDDIGRPECAIGYIKKRFLRIYPIYWVVILIILCKFFIFKNSGTILPNSAYSWIATFLLLPQANIYGGIQSPIDPVAWTLQYEVFFYALFLILLLSRKLGTIVGILLAVYYLAGSERLIFPFSTLKAAYLSSFALGILAAHISRFNIHRYFQYVSGFIGLLLVFLVAFKETVEDRSDFSESSLLIVGLAFFFIIVFLVALEKEGFAFGKWHFIQLLGVSSYSIYLVHQPLMHFVFKSLISHNVVVSRSPHTLLGVAAFTVLAGITICMVIEMPLLIYSKKLMGLSSSPRPQLMFLSDVIVPQFQRDVL